MMENRKYLQEISLIDFFALILKASKEMEEGEAQNTEAELKVNIKVEKDDHNDMGNEFHNNSLFSKQVEDTISM